MGNTGETYDVQALARRVAELEGEVAVLSRDNAQLSERASSAEAGAARSEARAQEWEAAHAALEADHAALATDYEELEGRRARLAADHARLEADHARLEASYGTLEASYGTLETSYAELKARYDSLEARAEWLVEQMRVATRRQWGRSSEVAQGQLALLFNDAEGFADGALPEAVPEAGKKGGKKKGRRQRRIDWDAYETTVVEHRLEGADLGCPACGSGMEPMGYEVTRELAFVPARVVVVEHRTWKYACRACSDANRADGGETPAVIRRAKAPEQPLPGSWASAGLLAHLTHQKFSLGMPVYRIADDLRRQCALPVCRQTVGSWVTRAAREWLAPVADAMARWLAGRQVLHADETVVQVLKEPNRSGGLGRKCYVWLFAAAELDEHPCYVFEYGPGRDAGVPGRFLGKGWSGTLVTDGYAGYNEAVRRGARRMSCLVHVRRMFVRVVDAAGGRGKCPRGSVALEALDRIDLMFAIDRRIGWGTPEERATARNEVAEFKIGRARVTTSLAEQMGAFEAFCRERLPQAAPRSQLERALKYAIAQWPHVRLALEDGMLPLDNNLAENAIRPFAVGRRSWLFCDTPSGASASCAAYSLVTTARANGLDDRRYVEWLLSEMPNDPSLRRQGADWSRYLPWSPDVPESCRADAPRFKDELEEAGRPVIDLSEAPGNRLDSD